MSIADEPRPFTAVHGAPTDEPPPAPHDCDCAPDVRALTPTERHVAFALRRAARITAAAGLPAEHRPAGFTAAAAWAIEDELARVRALAA